MLVKFTAYESGRSVYVRSEQIESILPVHPSDGSEIHTKNDTPRLFVRESPDEVAAALKEFTSMNAQKSLVLNGESQRLVDYVDGLPNKDDVLKYLIAQTQVALKECSKPSHRDYLG